ncbi:hypothetical protein HMPREF1013_00676 [Bacillus sp. 2_A_57_CT2]|nr:hypothetical protein HMPREF1013_00676 [Bacillus sp. 2_A_57_CT2]
MSGWGNFIPIGKASPFFKGHIDGNGFKIKNLTINDTSSQSGFIGYLQSGSIRNLGIENANVESTGSNVGILVGYLHKSTGLGIIENCYTTGFVSGSSNIGGLVGYTYSGSVDNCFSHANVTGLSYVGGLVGRSIANVPINKSLSTGKVIGPNSDNYAGGLIGFHQTPDYVTNSFYDMETSGQTLSSGGIGKTTSEMKNQSTYTGWEFATVWGINGDYPYLQMFGVPSAPAKKETISVASFVNLIIGNSDKYVKSTKQIQSYSVPIQTAIQRNTATLRNVSIYLSQLETNATKFSRTVRSSTANVTSFISPIGSYAYRESKTVRNLIAHIKPLESDINVSVPFNVFTPNAYVTIVENSSRAFKLEGVSNVSYVRNPSSVSEVMNVSEGHVIKNPSRVEVMK